MEASSYKPTHEKPQRINARVFRKLDGGPGRNRPEPKILDPAFT